MLIFLLSLHNGVDVVPVLGWLSIILKIIWKRKKNQKMLKLYWNEHKSENNDFFGLLAHFLPSSVHSLVVPSTFISLCKNTNIYTEVQTQFPMYKWFIQTYTFFILFLSFLCVVFIVCTSKWFYLKKTRTNFFLLYQLK